jgi:integrase
MASLYKRDRSPFYWVEHIDAEGERRQQSTKLRYGVPSEARKAQTLCSELTGRELARSQIESRGETWAAWVPRFLAQRYDAASGTLRRAETAWRNIEAFLRAQQVTVPRQLSRQQVRDYIEWRQTAHPDQGTRKAAKNTAILELKFLSAMMDEAVESGFANANPCVKLGIKRAKAKLKPKITPTEHKTILRALKTKPEWMRVSYEIAWEQGCRFSETCLPLSEVDLKRGTIGLRTKGHKESIAEVPLSPRLRPMLERMKRARRKMTFEMPQQPSQIWWRFFQEIDMPHLCFHCTRVTFISRCHEAGIPQSDVMRLVLHASETVHRIYPRVEAEGDRLQSLRAKI